MCVFVGMHAVAVYMTLFVSVCVELADARVCESVCSGSQEPSLVRLSRLIYGPAGEACHDFLNLKSQSHPPVSYSTLAAGRGLLHHLQYVKTCAQPLFPACVARVP